MGIFNVIQGLKLGKIAVAPLVGAWIEIFKAIHSNRLLLVAPLVGAWIEICYHRRYTTSDYVAPLVGAWIEITGYMTQRPD